MAYNSDAKMRTIMFFGGGPRKAPAAPVGYQGPLDLVPAAVAAYGVRALSSEMLGQNIFRLLRDSDNAEMDFAADATTGDAPTSAISAFLSGANGLFVVLYDQSGNGNNLITSGGENPLYVENVQGGKCGLADNGTNDGYMFSDVADTISLNGSLSFAYVAGAEALVSGKSSEFFAGNLNGDTYFNMTDGVNFAGADVDGDPSSYASYTGAFEFGNRTYEVNGVTQTTTSLDSGGAVGAITPRIALQMVSSTPGSDSKMQEVLLYSTLLDESALGLISANQVSYYSL